MYSKISAIAAAALLFTSTQALGINCRGSGLCDLATFEDTLPVGIAQGLRDAIYSANSTAFPDSTVYNSGDHVICVSTKIPITIDASVDAGFKDEGSASVGLSTSGGIGTGGVCVFPQHLKTGLTLGEIKPLADALLKHGCSTCGSVPVHYVDQNSNSPSDGILTFNYVGNPDCVGSCISA